MFTKKWWLFFCLGLFLFSLWGLFILLIPGISPQIILLLGTLRGIGIAWYILVGIPFLLKLRIFRKGMREEDVKIGMKVVPFRKTAGFPPLEESLCWSRACDEKQPYLYVIGWNEKVKAFMLNEQEYGDGGDFFNSRDFYPYKEPISV